VKLEDITPSEDYSKNVKSEPKNNKVYNQHKTLLQFGSLSFYFF